MAIDFSKVTAITIPEGEVTKIAINGTIVWKAQVPTYTVTFYNYDNTVLSTKSYPYGASLEMPSTPSRSGYVFDHWEITIGGNGTANSNTKVYSDLGIKAYFNIKSLTVSQSVTTTNISYVHISNSSSSSTAYSGTWTAGMTAYLWICPKTGYAYNGNTLYTSGTACCVASKYLSDDYNFTGSYAATISDIVPPAVSYEWVGDNNGGEDSEYMIYAKNNNAYRMRVGYFGPTAYTPSEMNSTIGDYINNWTWVDYVAVGDNIQLISFERKSTDSKDWYLYVIWQDGDVLKHWNQISSNCQAYIRLP